MTGVWCMSSVLGIVNATSTDARYWSAVQYTQYAMLFSLASAQNLQNLQGWQHRSRGYTFWELHFPGVHLLPHVWIKSAILNTVSCIMGYKWINKVVNKLNWKPNCNGPRKTTNNKNKTRKKNLRHGHRWQCACLRCTATCECREFFPVGSK